MGSASRSTRPSADRRAGDIRTDHANFFDTDAAAGRGRITKAVNLGNIEDGAWHNVELSWDADTRTLVTRFDGATVSTLSGDIVQKYLGGSDFAYFGFTAATGDIANAQQIRVNSVQAVFEDTSHDRLRGRSMLPTRSATSR